MVARGSAAVMTLIALVVAGAGSAHAGVAGTWHNAVEVPGSAALNRGGLASVVSISCPSAGNCAAGGSYSDSASNLQAFVASEVNGVWHTAVEVPGSAALNKGGLAQVSSVSCASAGNCAAGGSYYDSSHNSQAFVASEVNGVWHTAVEVPGTAALNRGGLAQVNSVSCESPGNCVAGGSYSSALAVYQAFAASEVNGTWHTAAELPGSAALNRGANAQVDSVSCVSGGNCGAGGFYTDSQGNQQVFVASEVSGVWHNAIEVPGTAALHKSGVAWLYSVSCASAGNCGVGGSYGDAVGREQAYVVSEVNGTWGTAIEVPGTAALNANGVAQTFSVACPSAGNCAAGGVYRDSAGHTQAFVVNEVRGAWRTALQVPGTAITNLRAGIGGVSCSSAGNCGAGGWFRGDGGGLSQAFVVNEVNGTWNTAIEVPGTAALNTGAAAGVNTISCPSAGTCGAGGSYTDGSGGQQAFVVNQS